MKKILIGIILLLSFSVLSACGQEKNNGDTGDKKEINIGATSGPYADMVKKAIKPILEEKGYKVEVTEFTDYVQPNNALAEGSIDANLFQHKIYMESFAEQNKLELSELISVPTAPMGIYSNKFDSLEDITDGATIAIPNDPTNAARAFLILKEAGLIEIDEAADPLTVSDKDVTNNVKNLKFETIEAAQLPRAVDSVDLSAVPGNFALAAKMNLLDALQLENMLDQYRNRVVVNTNDLDAPFAKDIKAAVESAEFEKVIDEKFEGFGKPEWMN